MAPTTVIDGSNVSIQWIAPNNRGSSIIAYTITIMQYDNVTFTQYLTDCDGSKASIVAASSCSVPISILRTTPFNLAWGSSIYAKVVATNIYGSSAVSNSGNGAIILTIPDAPLNIVENYSFKSGTTISLAWIDGVKNGGAPVIDFTISYNSDGTSNYDPLVTGLLVKSFTASALTPGVTYTFVVQSRNSFGISVNSAPFQTLCAWVPFTPIAPTTSVIGNRLQIIWTAPFANGSPLTKYNVLIKQTDGGFSEDLINCDGGSYTTFTSTACSLPLSVLTAAPYNLVQGQSVFAKVIASNYFGDSSASPLGNGGVVVLVPDAPLSLLNAPTITNAF